MCYVYCNFYELPGITNLVLWKFNFQHKVDNITKIIYYENLEPYVNCTFNNYNTLLCWYTWYKIKLQFLIIAYI